MSSKTPRPDKAHRARAITTGVEPSGAVELRRIKTQIVDLRDRVARLENASAEGPEALRQARRLDALREERRRRDTIFATRLFREAGWDLLLELYAARLAGRDLPVSRLCELADVPFSTGMRWIHRLEAEAWLRRVPDPNHKLRIRAELTPRALDAIRMFLDAEEDADSREEPA